MKKTKTGVRFFTIADHEKEQEYLSRMHRMGWRIVHVSLPCFYHFEACEPENVVYQLDYFQEGKFGREEYLKMFEDCGWEYLFDFMDYHYFRKPAAEMDGKEEIFCDDESRLDMMKRVFRGRVMWLLIMFLLVVLPQLIGNIMDYRSDKLYGADFLVFWSIMFIMYVLLLIRFAWKYYTYKKKAAR